MKRSTLCISTLVLFCASLFPANTQARNTRLAEIKKNCASDLRAELLGKSKSNSQRRVEIQIIDYTDIQIPLESGTEDGGTITTAYATVLFGDAIEETYVIFANTELNGHCSIRKKISPYEV